MRKLGFEEAPDYDFLRELFAKVMKNNGDIDDQVYDWNLLNGVSLYFAQCFLSMLNGWIAGGKGWESPVGQNNQTLQQVQNTHPTRRPDIHAQTTPVPPSPALVRHGSKKGQSPIPDKDQNIPGQLTPLSGVAQVNVSMTQNRATPRQDGYDFRQDLYPGNQTYDRASPMVSTIQNAQPPLTANRPTDLQNGGIPEQEESEPPKFNLWRILTCKCW